MKKIILFLVSALICSITVKAQMLTVKQMPDLVAFNGEGKYAIIIILAHNSYDLKFSTNQDGPDGSLIENIDQKQIGNQIESTLTFECKAANGATLRIDCPGYNRFTLPINLSPNEAVKYYIDDPEDPETKACSEKYRLLGEKYFLSAVYDKAKDAFKESLKCWTVTSGVDSSLINKRLSDIDSLNYYLQTAEFADKKYDYKKSSECYDAAFIINPDDRSIVNKRRESFQKYDQVCKEQRSKAELLLKRKDGKSLKPVLEKVIELNCSDVDVNWAKDKMLDIERWKNLQSRHTLTYEYAKGASLGFSSGNYNVDNSSGYFTLRFNPNLFDAFRMDDTDILQTELNVSFGFTLPVYIYDIESSSNTGLWLFFGPGGTVLANIGQKYITDNNEGGEPIQKVNTSRYNYHYAVSPEIGLLLKIPLPGSESHQIALRYTFQYRYAIQKADVDLIGKIRHVFGVGFTF